MSCTVDLEVRCAATAWGDSVAVVGSVPALGAWHDAIPLSPAPFPLWRASLSLTANGVVEYKYVLLRDGAIVKWETLSGNRVLRTGAAGTTLALRDRAFGVRRRRSCRHATPVRRRSSGCAVADSHSVQCCTQQEQEEHAQNSNAEEEDKARETCAMRTTKDAQDLSALCFKVEEICNLAESARGAMYKAGLHHLHAMEALECAALSLEEIVACSAAIARDGRNLVFLVRKRITAKSNRKESQYPSSIARVVVGCAIAIAIVPLLNLYMAWPYRDRLCYI